MYETRWAERHESLLQFKELYFPIINALKKLEHYNLETSQLTY